MEWDNYMENKNDTRYKIKTKTKNLRNALIRQTRCVSLFSFEY